MNEHLATATAPAATAPALAVRRRALLVGSAATALAVAAALWDAFKPQAGGADTGGLLYVLAAAVVVGALVFAWLVPARLAAGGTGLPLAIVSVPLIYAFWSGLPLITAAAAILLAISHRTAGGARSGRALAAIIVSALAIALTVAAVLLG
jgi:hypothetical protein